MEIQESQEDGEGEGTATKRQWKSTLLISAFKLNLILL